MNARIQYEGFDREESKKLKSFLSIANHFARRWNKQIVLDAPHGQAELVSLDTDDADKSVYLHFFCPVTDGDPTPTRLGYALELFHLKVPHQDLVLSGSFPPAIPPSGNDVAARFISKRNKFATLNSPEGRAVAQIAKNHVFILLDLAHRPWDGAGVVFWEILEAVDSYWNSENNNPERLMFLLQAHEMTRSRTVSSKEELKEDFARVSGLILERERAESSADIARKRNAMFALEEELIEAAAQVEIVQEVLRGKEAEEFSQERLLAEFEVILRYKRVLGLEVRGGDEICVYTRPIEHVSSNGERKMLSQYKIVIRPRETGRNGNILEAVKMAEWGWLGSHHHSESNIRGTYNQLPKGPCFGSAYVTSIQKSLLDHDYPVLIQELLHYLDSDSRSPDLRRPEEQSTEPYEEKPFYAAEHDRQGMALAYTELVRRHRGTLRKRILEEELVRARAVEQGKAEAFKKAREAMVLARYEAKFVEYMVNTLPAEEELDKVLAIPSLTSIIIGSKFIWLAFGPGKGVDRYKEVWFPGTFRVLVLPLEGILRIWGRRAATEDGLIKEQIDENGIHKHLTSLDSYFCRGRFGDALALIHDTLRGKEIPSQAAQGQEKTIEEMIRDFLFKEFPR